MAEVYKLIVFDEVLFVGGGDVNRWMNEVERVLHAEIVAHAPHRTGVLRASIHASVRHPGSHQIEADVGTDARHASYVLSGTGFPGKGRAGHIWTTAGFASQGDEANAFRKAYGARIPKGMPGAGQFRTRHRGDPGRNTMVRRKGFWLHLKPGGPIMFKVHGQAPNNFLLEGYMATRRLHSSLPLPPPSLVHI